MTKKKKVDKNTSAKWHFDDIAEEQAEEKKAPVVEKKKKEEVFFVPYITELWKGKIEVHKCVECDFYSESKDEIITHVLTHLPQAEQLAALDYLMEA